MLKIAVCIDLFHCWTWSHYNL